MSLVHELKEPFPHLIIENMYDDQELKLIWEELNFLTKPGKLLSPKHYGAVITEEGDSYTTALGIHLDQVYANRNISNILQINRKLFNYTQIYGKLSPHHIKFERSNHDITKIRYYHDGESYRPHADTSFDTLACTYFHKTPKKFSGGELYFPDYDYQISCDNNLCIIVPSYFYHGVREIKISDNDYYAGYGRYCMTQFTHTVL